jgi:ubiquinone/menaquinone biosynthesis C-methylase UbiE
MSDIQLSTQIAEVYDEFFVPALFAEWPARLLAAAAVQSGQHILDVACGTGALARTAAEWVGMHGAVIGLDLNPGMLAVAKKKAPAIDWRQGRVVIRALIGHMRAGAAVLPSPSRYWNDSFDARRLSRIDVTI